MSVTAIVSKGASWLGVLLGVAAIGYWGRFWFLTSNPTAMTDAFVWTFLTLVVFGVGIGTKKVSNRGE